MISLVSLSTFDVIVAILIIIAIIRIIYICNYFGWKGYFHPKYTYGFVLFCL